MAITKLVAVVLAAVVGLGASPAYAQPPSAESSSPYLAAHAPRKPAKPKGKKTRLTFEQKVWREVGRIRGANSTRWTIGNLPGGSLGLTFPGWEEVWVDPDTPDWALPYVVKHEWAHIMQARVYGPNGLHPALAHLGGPEVIADCGAKVLGYGGRGYYVRKCSRAQLDAARRILRGQPA